LSGFALESALGASVGWRWLASGSAAQAQIIFVRAARDTPERQS
jgi:hypothetical protein